MASTTDYETPDLDATAERMMQFLRLVGMRGHTVQRIADQCDVPEGTVRSILGGASVKHGACFERCGTQGKKLLWRVNEPGSRLLPRTKRSAGASRSSRPAERS
jgi:hypothetical protein